MALAEQRWRRRPFLAFLIVAGVRLLPIAAGFGAGVLMGHITGRPAGVLAVVVWLAGLLVVSTLVVVAFDRLARRALPLAALFRMALLVPDRTPSRFQIALRSSRSRHGITNPPKEAGAAAGVVLGLIAELNSHDRRTRGHSERVAAYADLIGDELHLGQRERELLRWAALLHDIGKLQVSFMTLNKRGVPDPQEWRELRTHPAEGGKIVAPMREWLGPWAAAVVQHHERWDGKGYPGGIAGLQISQAARIIAVADAFESMTESGVSADAARAELTACAGTQFDPVVVKAFLRVSLGRLRWVMGPLAWLGEQPLLAQIGEAGAKAGSVGARIGVGAATVGAVTGAVVSGGGLPHLTQHAPPAAVTTTSEDTGGHGVIDVFSHQLGGVNTTTTTQPGK